MAQVESERNKTEGYAVRRMSCDEVGFAIDLAAKEGWNPGLNDAHCFYQADPKGFLIGELNGHPISCISAVAYDEGFGFLGLYIVRPEFRRKGFGIRIWNEAVAQMGKRNVGLDGVLAQQKNYERSGFKLAYRNIRFEGDLDGTVMDHAADDQASGDLRKLSSIPFEKLIEYDRRHFPSLRPGFLKSWIDQPDSFSYAAMKDGLLCGYGVIRACTVGFKIGPLFADDEDIANNLFPALAMHAKSAPVFLDVPEINKSALELAESYEMKRVFETVRMYTGGVPSLPIDQIFGVTTFELG